MNYVMMLLSFVIGCNSKVEVDVDSGPETVPSPITWTECSQQLGEHPCDIQLLDQNGEQWSLYDGWGSIQVLDFSTGWCGYCNASGATLQSIQDEFKDAGVIFVTILIEDPYGNPVDTEFARAWAERYSISSPVVAGSRELISDDPQLGWPINGWPRYYFITRDLLIHSIQPGFSDQNLKNTVEMMLIEEAEVTQ